MGICELAKGVEAAVRDAFGVCQDSVQTGILPHIQRETHDVEPRGHELEAVLHLSHIAAPTCRPDGLQRAVGAIEGRGHHLVEQGKQRLTAGTGVGGAGAQRGQLAAQSLRRRDQLAQSTEQAGSSLRGRIH